MSNDNPFFLSKVECPICKAVNEFETVRVGAYYENGRDTDFCPKDITWRYPRCQGYNPLVFFTAMCGNCFYTREFTNSLKEWKSDTNFRTYRLKTVKERHLEQLAVADSVLRSIGQMVDCNRYPNESAILKLLLAVFDEQLADRYSNLDVGRFYLRIAWVFRDLEKGENPGQKFLQGLMLEIDRQLNDFRESAETCQNRLQAFERHLLSHFESGQLSTEIKSRIAPYRDRFAPELQALRDSVAGTGEKMTGITRLIDEYKTAALGSEGAHGGIAFGDNHSFAEFLMKLRKTWDGIVFNEREAIQKAIQHYEEAFAGGRDISPGNQQIQASYLIAELSRRVGDYDKARQYFNSTIKHGQEFIYQNRKDPSRTALARKILELAIEQGKLNMAALKAAQES